MLILHKNICCDPSSEPSHRDGSDEGSQHIVSIRNKKNYPSVIIKYLCFSSYHTEESVFRIKGRDIKTLVTFIINRALYNRKYLMMIKDNIC